LEEPGIDGRIILNRSWGNGKGAWTGLKWFRIETGGAHF
jgi:hypothetical protein